MYISCHPAISLLRISSVVIHIGNAICKVIHCSTVHNDKILETTQVGGEREATYVGLKITFAFLFWNNMQLCKGIIKVFLCRWGKI